MSSSVLISAKNLVKVYQKRPVVNQVNITINKREIVGLLGPNGAGKTTTFYMLAGLVNPTVGEVTYRQQNITHMPMHQRASLGMSYLPQEESIFKGLTVEQNLLAILETVKTLNKKQQREKMESLLERFQITHIRKSLAISLSGGEKRRLTIARCLCTNPKILMLDEPFAGVDPKAVASIHEIINTLREQDGITILITDHHVRETLKIVDRAYVMDNGKVILEGASHDIANDPIAKKHYLGEDFTL